jgi:arylsulfatase
VYEQNVAHDRVRLVSTDPVPVGRTTLRFEFRKEATLWAALKGLLLEGPDFDRLRVLAGTGALFIGDRRVAEGWLPRPVFAVWEGMDVGQDSNTPVSPLYAAPFPFRGTLERVVFELE